MADALEKLGYTPGLADMLRRMLDWNPETRLRPSQIIKSPEDFPFFDEKTIDTILQAIPPGTREMELEDYASQTITGEPAADDVLAFLKLREMQREKYVKFAEVRI